ncbi:MAG: restriction endonuclease subunit S [Chloroflexi bacterium]|nr:restriction endonuclease subunit S [Chloroflexota bacterium]
MDSRKRLYEYFNPQLSQISIESIRKDNHRLDASGQIKSEASTIQSSHAESSTILADLADVFTVYIQGPVLAYVSPNSKSRPYLTTSEVGEYPQKSPSHVSLVADPRLIGWEIKDGYILVSRSGRVGEVYWVDKKLDGSLVGDCFRVVAKDPNDREFLYTFLKSSFAQSFITAYGSVVDHASLAQLRNTPIPSISVMTVDKVKQSTGLALQSRLRAAELLDEADQLIHELNGLDILADLRLDQTESGWKLETNVLSSFELAYPGYSGSEFRLDAHFYNPRALLAIAKLKSINFPLKTIQEITDRVFFGSRFTRTFVSEAHGVPYLAGKNIIQIRPTDLRYLSLSETDNLDDYLLHPSWILLTCSGTIGRVGLVWSNFEKYAGTHDLIRIIANDTEVDFGYLYAFLGSLYGQQQILRHKHGSVIDHITPDQVQQILVPLPPMPDQRLVGDKVRLAYEKRAEAIRLEDEALEILTSELTLGK